MARPELGNKHSCTSCGAKFYDLNRSPFVCPKCNQAFTESPSSALIAVATPVEKVVPPKSKVRTFDDDDDDDDDDALAGVEIDDVEDDDDDSSADTFLDDDDDDDNDVTGIIGGGIKKEES